MNLRGQEEKLTLLRRLHSEDQDWRRKLRCHNWQRRQPFTVLEYQLRFKQPRPELMRLSEDQGLKLRWNAKELRERQCSEDQEQKQTSDPTLCPTSLKNPVLSPSCSNQDQPTKGTFQRCCEDRGYRLKLSGYSGNIDPYHHSQNSYGRLQNHLSFCPPIEEYICVRSDHFALFYLTDCSIIEFVPYLAHEVFAIGLVVTGFRSTSVETDCIEVIFVYDCLILLFNPRANVKSDQGIVNHSLDLSIVCFEPLQVDNENIVGFNNQFSLFNSLNLLAISAFPTAFKHLWLFHEVEAIVYAVPDIRVIVFFKDIACSFEQFFLIPKFYLNNIIEDVGNSIGLLNFSHILGVEGCDVKSFEEILLVVACDFILKPEVVQTGLQQSFKRLKDPWETKDKPIFFVTVLKQNQRLVFLLMLYFVKDIVIFLCLRCNQIKSHFCQIFNFSIDYCHLFKQQIFFVQLSEDVEELIISLFSENGLDVGQQFFKILHFTHMNTVFFGESSFVATKVKVYKFGLFLGDWQGEGEEDVVGMALRFTKTAIHGVMHLSSNSIHYWRFVFLQLVPLEVLSHFLLIGGDFKFAESSHQARIYYLQFLVQVVQYTKQKLMCIFLRSLAELAIFKSEYSFEFAGEDSLPFVFGPQTFKQISKSCKDNTVTTLEIYNVEGVINDQIRRKFPCEAQALQTRVEITAVSYILQSLQSILGIFKVLFWNWTENKLQQSSTILRLNILRDLYFLIIQDLSNLQQICLSLSFNIIQDQIILLFDLYLTNSILFLKNIIKFLLEGLILRELKHYQFFLKLYYCPNQWIK